MEGVRVMVGEWEEWEGRKGGRWCRVGEGKMCGGVGGGLVP